MKSEDIHKSIRQLIQKSSSMETDIKINNLVINKDGFSNNIAMLTLIHSKNGENFSKDIVLKNFPTNVRNDSGKKYFNKELAILKNKAISSSINVPRVYFDDEENQIVLMEKIEGLTLDKLYLMNPEKTVWAYRKFGETLARIHSVDLDTVRWNFSDTDIWKEDYLKLYINRLKNRVMEFEEPKYLQVLENLYERFRGVKFNEVLNHGDYHFWNIIVDDDASLYVLDWEKARISDYRYDLANTLVLGYSWFGVDFKEQMIDAYEILTKKKIERLDCFIALLSFDSFTKVVPLIQGGDDTHIRDRTFEWLKRRYELFVRYNGIRIKEAENFLISKGLSLTI
ncbi:aminoglycoside phosphotransferase family protein [Psychrobacillus sp. NPDC096426]|uniref:aminoglycoside phosphotransferase family protein n=1 Tax=Psychrobacillus sp. NPDC096426 TaxID=3364491 RepID=UPI0037F73DD2